MQSVSKYTRETLLGFLAKHGLVIKLIEHPAVATCADVAALPDPIPGTDTKHLFIRNREGQFFLVMTRADKRIDLNALREITGSRVQFASAEELFLYLGIYPGCVSMLAAINDVGRKVRLLADTDLAEADDLQQHPLENVATLLVPRGDFRRFFRLIERELEWTCLPERVPTEQRVA